MGVPYEGVDMTAHRQYVTVRNARGRELLDSVSGRLETTAAVSSGDRVPFVLETVLSDDRATLGEGPKCASAAAAAWVCCRQAAGLPRTVPCSTDEMPSPRPCFQGTRADVCREDPCLGPREDRSQGAEFEKYRPLRAAAAVAAAPPQPARCDAG